MPADVTSYTAITDQRGRCEDCGEHQRGQIRGEVGPQAVEAAGHHHGGIVPLFGKLSWRQRGHATQHLAAQIGDHRRGAALGQTSPAANAQRLARTTVRRAQTRGVTQWPERPCARISDHAGEDVRQRARQRRSCARDHHAARHSRGQVATQRGRSSPQSRIERSAATIWSGRSPRSPVGWLVCRQQRCACGTPNTSTPDTRQRAARRALPPRS